jgi:Fur family ferric uptake transcriptional regulator
MDLQSLKNMGVKITKHKIVILQLFDLYKHLDASQIHSLLRAQGTDISLATIYRILSVFESNNILEKHNFNEDQAIYELVRPNEHHDHLVCVKCNKVIEFFDCKIERIQERIAKENKFRIVNHHLNLYGICEDCEDNML